MTNNKALTTTNGPQLPSRHYLEVPGMQDLTLEEDLIIGRWRIVQKSSTIDGEPGQFNNNLTGELRDCLALVILNITPSRAYFTEDRQLTCISTDGRRSLSGKLCLDCSYKDWGPDQEAPACSRGYTFVCYDPQDKDLCLVGALRTSVRPARLYFTMLHKLRQPTYAYLTLFEAKQETGPKGVWYTLAPGIQEQIAEEEWHIYQEMATFLAGVHLIEVTEPGEVDDDSHQGPPPPQPPP